MPHWLLMHTVQVTHSCNVGDIGYMIDRLKAVCLFFQNSPKRNGLLEAVVAKDVPGSRKRALIDLCCTRWAERHDAYTHFYNSYVSIVRSLEVIAESKHKDKYDPDFTEAKWDQKSKTDACGLLRAITSFPFIITFMIAYQFLSHLEGMTLQLQKTSVDIIQAYDMVSVNIFYIFMQ